MMESNLQITLLIVSTVGAGILAQVVAGFLRLPSIVFLLLFGLALGRSGLNLIHPDWLGNGLEVMVPLAVALILFEGGLNLELRTSEAVSGSIRNLVTIGTLITFIGGGMAAHWLGEFPWPIAFLYAALVVVTGPTVINPLLKQVQADRQLTAVLEGEGVLIDPIGAILAVVVLNIVLQGNTDPWTVVVSLTERLGVGATLGFLGGFLLGWFLQRATWLSNDLKNLVVLAVVWSLFGTAQAFVSESGLMTAVTVGITLRLAVLPEERLLRRFMGQLSTLAISVLFILLAADLSLASVIALGWGSLFTVLTLMLIVRPLNVLVSTWNSGLNWRQKAFLSWIAPRGIVAASVASLFAISLTNQGINGGDSIKALVFLTIAATVFIQGLSAHWVADLLKIRSQEATGAMIVGCNPLGRLVGRLMQERGERVVMIDANPEYCDQAVAEGLQVFLSSALDMEVLQEAGLPHLGTFLAVTSNAEVNSVLAQRVREEFHPPRVLAVFPGFPESKGKSPDKLEGLEVQPAFSPDLSVKQWNQYLSGNEVKISETVLAGERMHLQQAHLRALIHAGKILPLLVERQERLRVVLSGEDWQASDRLIYLLHTPKPKALPPGLTAWHPRNQVEKVLIPPVN